MGHKTSITMPRRAIRAFVWDLADEGIDEVLGNLREAGVDGLHLALAYHGGRFYCPHNPKHLVVHAPDGALYFQPLLSCYESLKPRVHHEYGSGAFVARVREACHDYQMNMTAWVALLNNMTLSMAHPEVTCRNVMGDLMDGALCPASPAVRTYAQALVEDLAHRVGVDVIEIEDFAFASHESYIGHSWRGMKVGPALGYLMSLCFCEHCREAAEEANIEIDDLAYHVERMIRSGLAGDLSERRIMDEIADPYNLISRYARMRGEVITSLLDDLIDATGGSPAVVQPILREHPDENWRWGIELGTLRERMTQVTLAVDCQAPAARSYVDRYLELLQMNQEVAACVPLCDPRCSGAQTSNLIESCEQAGIERFVFFALWLGTVGSARNHRRTCPPLRAAKRAARPRSCISTGPEHITLESCHAVFFPSLRRGRRGRRPRRTVRSEYPQAIPDGGRAAALRSLPGRVRRAGVGEPNRSGRSRRWTARRGARRSERISP